VRVVFAAREVLAADAANLPPTTCERAGERRRLMSTHRRQAFVALRLSGARPVPGLMDGIVSTTDARRVIR
jgi:hypothetical protein